MARQVLLVTCSVEQESVKPQQAMPTKSRLAQTRKRPKTPAFRLETRMNEDGETRGARPDVSISVTRRSTTRRPRPRRSTRVIWQNWHIGDLRSTWMKVVGRSRLGCGRCWRTVSALDLDRWGRPERLKTVSLDRPPCGDTSRRHIEDTYNESWLIDV